MDGFPFADGRVWSLLGKLSVAPTNCTQLSRGHEFRRSLGPRLFLEGHDARRGYASPTYNRTEPTKAEPLEPQGTAAEWMAVSS